MQRKKDYTTGLIEIKMTCMSTLNASGFND